MNHSKIRFVFVLLILSQILSSCSQLPINENEAKDQTIHTLIETTLKPKIKNIFNSSYPIYPPEHSQYPLIKKLPGLNFDPTKSKRSEIKYDVNGNLLLSQGDYVIPVMTYCMRASGDSPNGHIYSLSKLEGVRTQMIRELNLRGPPKFNPSDIQIVSWSLQAGLIYEEMTLYSRTIIDAVIPQFKPQLKESPLTVIEKQWDKVSNISNGILPTFEASTDTLLGELGDVGKKIIEIRSFKSRLHDIGHDYARLRDFIHVSSDMKNRIIDSPWSQVSSNIYARFITDGHFQEIGFVQIRITKEEQKRQISSVSRTFWPFDIMSLMANPNSDVIQPLSFSPIFGLTGVMILPELAEIPLAATLVLSAVLANLNIDWDSFFKLYDLLKNSNNTEVQEELNRGTHVLQEAHDDLEKPLREAGVIDEKTKDTSISRNAKVREYTKSGGDQKLKEDFDRIPGDASVASDGTEYKTLPSGERIIERPATKDKPATLEVQPSNSPEKPKTLRIKVRYL